MKRWIHGLLVLGVSLATTAHAEEPSAVGDLLIGSRNAGLPKKLSEWILLLDDKGSNSVNAQEALIERGRFLIGAHTVVVPALIKRARADRIDMISNLGRYGPLAKEALEFLRTLKDHRLRADEALCARILIGDERASNLKAFVKKFKASAKDREGKVIERVRYADLVSDGMRLGPYVDAGFMKALRGYAPLKTASRRGMDLNLIQTVARMQLPVFCDFMISLRYIGPSVTPLVRDMEEWMSAEDVLIRNRMTIAIAAADKLKGSTLKRLLNASFSWGSDSAEFLKNVAIYRHEDTPRLLAFFRENAAKNAEQRNFDNTNAWAWAGIARLAPDDPGVQAALLGYLLHKTHGVRVAAAHGLMFLATPDAALLEHLVPALSDVDLRVRWRAAAVLLQAGSHVDAALLELIRGIEGPCDWERLLAFEAVARIGAPAAPLRANLGKWAKSPSKRIAGAAKRALSKAK